MVASHEHAQTAPCLLLAPRPTPATRPTAITVYGCGPDEAALFRALAPRLGARLRITEAPVCETNVGLAAGNRCISVGHKSRVSNATLQALSEAGVRYISTRSAGRNHIDVEAAQRLGMRVEGVAYSPDSVADFTLMLMLMAVRDARPMVVRAEAHDFRLHTRRGRELRDLTVGVIGTGRIGTAVVERLRGFGCTLLAYDRTPKTDVEHVGLDELLQRSDIVTLHTPLTAQTAHLLDAERIGRMRPGAILVNTGRGSLVDTVALVSALESGRLGGAALDVLEGEEGVFYAEHSAAPPPNPLLLRLQRLPNVLITPHTAYYTDHALRDTVANTILNCREFEGLPHD